MVIWPYAINMVIRAVAAIQCCAHISFYIRMSNSADESCEIGDFITRTFTKMSLPYENTICYTEALTQIRFQLLYQFDEIIRGRAVGLQYFFFRLLAFVGILMIGDGWCDSH